MKLTIKKTNIVKHLAFTLAEVLITLGIIGVVAAMTIPILLNNAAENEFRSAVKEDYSILQQAVVALANEGELDLTSELTLMESFVKKLKIIDINKTSSSLLYQGYYKYYKGSSRVTKDSEKTDPTIVLNNGAILQGGGATSPNCDGATSFGNNLIKNKLCASFNIDVNGTKGPNMYGRDFVAFWLVKDNGVYKVLPVGTEENYTCESGSTAYNTSFGCTAYYINEKPLP